MFSIADKIFKIKSFFLFKQDLDISYNVIKELNRSLFKNLVSLVTLNLRENQLVALSSDINDLKKLERLDLTNNSLAK